MAGFLLEMCMVYPLRKPSNESVQEAIFNYLNLNRHKFNDNGKFDPSVDERDFVPPILVSSYDPKPPKLTPEVPRLNAQQRHWVKNPVANQLRNPKTDEDLVRERYEERLAHAKKRRKYSKDQCEKHYEAALKRCNDMYWNNALYPKSAFDGCKQRATELWNHCNDKGKYPEKKKEWANEDMGIVDESAISKPPTITFERGLEPLTELPVLQPNVSPEMQFHESPEEMLRPAEASWARGQLGHISPPLVEGSQQELPTEFQRLLPLMPHLARALQGIRVTRGAGAGGGIGSRFGKRPLSRMPIDALNSNAFIY